MVNLKISIKLLFIIALVSLAGCSVGSDEDMDSLEKDYLIVYNVLVDKETDNYDIFTINPDGSNKRNITNHPGVDWTYFAYENKIPFISDRDSCGRCYFLYEMGSDGSDVRKIYNIQLADSWMSTRRNDTEIIVKPSREIDSAFHIIDFGGNLISRVYTGLPYSNDPLFVNQGEQIVFRGGSKSSKREPGFNEELYVINTDGSDRRRLTHYPESDTTAEWYAYRAGVPVLNPAENFITYQSKQQGKYSLFAVDLEGRRQWKLTGLALNEGWHSWSPDGRWLAIELFDNEQTRFNIGLMNWESKELKILTDSTYQYQQAPIFVLK